MQDRPTPASGALHLEDLEVGRTISFGHKLVTKEEIIAFAQSYDPQRIHLDEEYAKTSIVGGLCASGFHSCAMLMRMIVDDVLNHMTSLGSPGMDEVRWTKPVRPGDVLSARYTVKEKRALGSRPDVGLSKVFFEMLNQKGELVMSWDSNQLLRVRRPDATAAPRSAKPAEHAALQSLWGTPPGPPPSGTSSYFEDRIIGEMTELGSHTFGKDEIIDFARAYDPQPFHLDEVAAKASLFGGLCASGWHTAAIHIRLSIAARRKVEQAIVAAGNKLAVYGPSPGFKNIRWLKPVYPGDTIEFRSRLINKVDLKSRPERGLIVSESQGRNQRGEIVFSINGQILAERREAFAG